MGDCKNYNALKLFTTVLNPVNYFYNQTKALGNDK